MNQSQIKTISIEEMVNLVDYPVSDADSNEFIQLTNRCREQYLDTGLCELPNFILPDALSILAGEANQFSAQAYFCQSTHNAYLNTGDDLPDDSAHQHQEQTYVGSVAYDRIPGSSNLKRLYLWDPLKEFIGRVLGKTTFYRFADPFGACSINVFVNGGEHGWHFDESEFTITLMLQSPEQGGDFEYVPKIRGLDDEVQIVEGVLNGNREGVVHLPFTPGTLLIFGGNQTIHRVTRVSGDRPRLVPVLCFSEQPDAQNSETVRELFWGRRGPGSPSSVSQQL